MSISYMDALELLKNDTLSVDDIKSIVAQVSAKVFDPSGNATYLLYSGKFQEPDGWTSALAIELKNAGGFVDIGNSSVGELLASEDFQKALGRALKLEVLNDPYGKPTADQVEILQKRWQEVLYGKDGVDLTAPRLPKADSLWDIASENYVKEASGDFKILAPNKVDDLSVFVQRELPALLSNGNVGVIDGVSRSDLLALSEAGNIEAVKQILTANSFTNLSASGLLSEITSENISKYIELTPDSINENGFSAKQIVFMQEALQSASEDVRDYLKKGADLALDLSKIADSGFVKALGPIGIGLSFMIASFQANALEEAGDHEGAQEIMNLWAAESSGSELGSIAAGAIAGVGLAALAAAGVVIAAPLAAVIVIGAMVAGGYFGGENAKDFYLFMNEMSDEQKLDIVTRMNKLFFEGDDGSAIDPIEAAESGSFDFDKLKGISESRDQIVTGALDSIAWRYALHELNPFVVHGADYAKHNSDGSLDLYDPATGLGQMTQEWIESRASFLVFDSLYRKSGDTDGSFEMPLGLPVTMVGDVHFVDRANDGVYELLVDGVDFGLVPTREFLFGGDGVDDFVGGGGDDRIFGGDGGDTLNGRKGEDYLEGGAGNDKYYFNHGDGKDTVFDVTGANTLYIEHSAGGGHKTIGVLSQISQGSNNYLELGADGKPINDTVYTLVANEAGGTDLQIVVAQDGGTILIKQFEKDTNAFGIEFSQSEAPEAYVHNGNFNYGGDIQAWYNASMNAGSGAAMSPAEHLSLVSQMGRQFGINQSAEYDSDGLEVLADDGIRWQFDTTAPNTQPRTTQAGGAVLDVGFIFDTGVSLALTNLALHNDLHWFWGERNAVTFEGGHQGDTLTGFDQVDIFSGHAGQDFIIGNAGDDVLDGGAGDDQVYGGDGNDLVFGNYIYGSLDKIESGVAYYSYAYESATASDYLDGGAGDDRVVGGQGQDRMLGGAGDDYLLGGWGDDNANGGAGRDILFGDSSLQYSNRLTQDADGNEVAFRTYLYQFIHQAGPAAYTYDDTLSGGAGNDILVGELGNDTLFGGDGDDELWGDRSAAIPLTQDYFDANGEHYRDAAGEIMFRDIQQATPLAGALHGNDVLFGGDGNDQITGGGGDDELHGDAGDDTLIGDHSSLAPEFHGRDVLHGGDGADQLWGEGGDDTLYGDAGADHLEGGTGNDLLYGGTGDDELLGGAGSDELYGDAGDDQLQGDDGDDLLHGGGGNDGLRGGSGDDQLFGDSGHDQVEGGAGNDLVYGGAGNDWLFGNQGQDQLYGGSGDDGLVGGSGDDSLYGGNGNDELTGDEGNDLLQGGAGQDTLAGGAGDDTYVFAAGDALVNGEVADTIVDTEGRNQLVLPTDIEELRFGMANGWANFVFGSERVVMSYATLGTFDAISLGDTQYTMTGLLKALQDANNLSYSGPANLSAGTQISDVYFFSGAFQDQLYGGHGDDVLSGGKGDDVLIGGQGADTYLYSAGDGYDKITAYGDADNGPDTLLLGAGIAPADVRLERSGDKLYLNINNSGERITVETYFSEDAFDASKFSWLNIQFDDGTVWNFDAVNQVLATATAGDDKVWGSSGADQLQGLAGNDVLYGLKGDDQLDGGAGNDHLIGGEGNDLILYGFGDGADYIEQDTSGDNKLLFKASIAASNVVLQRLGSALLLTFSNSPDDSILIQSYFAAESTNNSGIGTLAFADGTEWDFAHVKSAVLQGTESDDVIIGYSGDDVLFGRAGDDSLFGGTGDDVLEGGAGNDALSGGTGNDVYWFGYGDGVDTLNNNDANASSVDTLKFKPGVDADSVNFARSGQDLIVTLVGSEDQVIVDDFFYGANAKNQIDRFEFANGVVQSAQDIMAALLLGDGADNRIEGYASHDTIHGLQGDDLIHGGGGDDTITGDEGDDRLFGEAGDDHLEGGAGHDDLFGDDGNDLLQGDAGNDYLGGGNGSDTLRGGQGDDDLHGGGGDDRYVYALGDGFDNIVDYSGQSTLQLIDLNLADAVFRRNGTSLDISFSGNDTVRFYGWFNSPGYFLRDGLTFVDADGSEHSWTAAEIETATLVGSAADDHLAGNEGDNLLTGAAGNDVLEGLGGNDTYVYQRGDGADQIIDSAGIDTLTIGGYAANELVLRREGSDLVVFDAASLAQVEAGETPATPTEIIRIRNQFNGELPADATPIDSVVIGAITLDAAGILAATLQGSALGDVINGYATDDIIAAGAGSDWINPGRGDDIVYGEAGDDIMVSSDGDDELVGGAGDDQLSDYSGNNILRGGDGKDTLEGVGTLYGDGGDDALDGNGSLYGGAGKDNLTGYGLLDGGAGDDHLNGEGTLRGGDGDDTLTVSNFGYLGDDAPNLISGGLGNDVIYGSYAADTYQFNVGDGEDLLVETLFSPDHSYSSTRVAQNTLEFGGDIALADLSFIRRGQDLIVEHMNGTDKITIQNWYYPYANNEDLFKVQSFSFADGALLTSADVENRVVYRGTENSETLLGHGARSETFEAGAGNDTVDAKGGEDRLFGGAGNDLLTGGQGNDLLDGGDGDDKYVYQNNSGIDTIRQTGDGYDGIQFNVAGDRLSYLQEGNDLLITVDNDSTQRVRVEGHFLGGDAAIDYILLANGQEVTAEAIAQIINAPASDFDQVITGTNNGENLQGSAGKDQISGLGGNDVIFGFAGDDALSGDAGDDTLDGGDGNDLLAGGNGNDVYYYRANAGQDEIHNAGGGTDAVYFIGISEAQLSATQEGNDLVLQVDNDEQQQVRVIDHFLGADTALEQLGYDDGNGGIVVISLGDFLANQTDTGSGDGGDASGGDQPFTANPADYDQVIDANSSQTFGSNGRDYIRGYDQPDQLFGFAGDDFLEGNAGDDYLAGGNGSGSGSGNDILVGGAGQDTLVGEDGDDILAGGADSDHYYLGANSGRDLVIDSGGSQDVLFFNGVASNRLHWYQDGNDLVVRIDDDELQQVRVQDHFAGASIEWVQPAQGESAISKAQIASLVSDLLPPADNGGDAGGDAGPAPDAGTDVNPADYDQVIDAVSEQTLGSSGADYIRGLAQADQIFGFTGDDYLQGNEGDDYLSGGNGSFSDSGDDILVGGAGNDTLVGEDGNDTLAGGAGDDSYLFTANTGQDTVEETAGGTDWLFFNGINREQLFWYRQGDDLLIRVDDSVNNQVTVANHFQGGDRAIEYVQPGDGGYAISAASIADQVQDISAAASANSVDQLIQAMATYDSNKPFDTAHSAPRSEEDWSMAIAQLQ